MHLNISKIESLAMHDGQGIRSAVFVAGCPLRCVCCHNPEALSFNGGQAIEVDELCNKIMRLKPYFRNGGGVTITGGEPLASAREVTQFCILLKEKGIHIALDTSGYLLNEEVKKLIYYCDQVLLDIKYPDQDGYDKYVGCVDFDTVVAFGKYCVGLGKSLWLRTVIIPGINDTEDYINRYAKVAREIGGFSRYELLGFHTLGFSKYVRLGIKNQLEGKESLLPQVQEKLQKHLDLQL